MRLHLPRATACVLLFGFIVAAAAAATTLTVSGERRLNFNEDWRFYKGDSPGAEQPGFADSQWRALDLPHDWAIEGPFDSKANPHTGALPIFGTGWYRKSFALPDSAKAKFFSIEFDGAMSNSTVWINGHELGSRPYGYIGFSYDLTPYLQFGAGKTNVLAVRLTPEDKSSRWYPGAGLYRNVWLNITGPIHVTHWGTYVTTPEVNVARSTVAVKVELRNRTGGIAAVVVQNTILDPAGKTVSRNGDKVEIPSGGAQTTSTRMTVNRPELWDTDRPAIYTLVTEIIDAEKTVVDRYETPFGIRTVVFNREQGFLLNGRHMKFQGVCNHSDLGALGMAVNRRATERQLQIMKSAGVNAIRTSHNPPSPELLELCDRMGLLVMDESFDMWKQPKVANGYAKFFDEWSERDARDFVHRDRNHPSVIMWSIGNEIPEQSSPKGGEMARRLTAFFHEEDPTRPTTSAFNSPDAAVKNHLGDNVDLFGVNYKPWLYAKFQKEHPTWIVYGSETSSCVSSRGAYHLPIEKYEKHPSLELTGYDVIAPSWAYCPDVEFTYQDQLPNVLGEFVWTGFDYIGEPTPYFEGRGEHPEDWPARSSYFGFVDLAGFPKDRFYLYQSRWTSAPMVHILPHWTWPGRAGQLIPVMAYSNAADVELFLNGKSLGRKKTMSEQIEIPVGKNASSSQKFMTKYRLEWMVPYTTGTLRAVAYTDGKQVAVDEVRTAGAPARIKLVPDRSTIHADGEDLSFVTVRVEDKDGNLCPNGDNLVKFSVGGAGALRAVDNGNSATTESFQADHRKAFHGLALLIVGSTKGQPGRIQISATSDGLPEATAEIVTQK